MKNKTWFTLAGVVTAMSLLIVASSSAAEKKFEKKFSVSPGGTLTLTTEEGSVAVVGTSSNELRITTEIKGSGHDVDAFDVSAEQTDKGVNVTGRESKGGRWPWDFRDLDVRFQVEVPHEYSLDLRTSGGDLNVNGVKGRVVGETSGGDLVVAAVEGNIRMQTSGGNIRSSKLNGDINLETSGGDVEISSVTGAVDASTSGGNIRVGDADGMVKVGTSGGNVVVKLSGGNKGIHAETSGGNIDITVPKGIGADIDASTLGGEVVCDLPLTTTGKISESKVHGTVNGGGSAIHAHTSGGDVRIRQAP